MLHMPCGVVRCGMVWYTWDLEHSTKELAHHLPQMLAKPENDLSKVNFTRAEQNFNLLHVFIKTGVNIYLDLNMFLEL